MSIEVPKDWKVQSIQSLAELNKENRRNGKPMNLEVFASAERLTSGAIITIAVQSPPNWTQRRLSSAKASDLQATSKAISQQAFGKLSPSGIGKVITGPTYEVQTFPNSSAKYLAVSYREEETMPKGHVITWKTTHLYLPRQTDELEIIFAYHEKHEQFWRPVMEKALTTLLH